MATAPPNTTPAAAHAATGAGVVRHANDHGMEAALGVGRNGKRLNTHAADLQEAIDEFRDEFLEVRSVYIGRERHDFMRNGMLGEIVSRTPILVYDLPELKARVNTAFVDKSGKMYICDTFLRRLLAEHEAGLDSLNFLVRHEADHLRRLHLSRMVDCPHDIANIAQDIRINIDITKAEAAERYAQQSGRQPNDNELRESAKKYLLEHAHSAIGGGCAMTYEDYVKFDGLSEEAIAAILMKDWKAPPKVPNREVSFGHIMEGAACEADNVKGILLSGKPLAPTAPPFVMTPAELSGLAQDLRRIGKAKANPAQVSTQDLQDAYDRLGKLKENQGLVELDVQHAKAAMGLVGSGAVHSSGKSGDPYLDAMQPSQRVEIAMRVLEKILNPTNSNGVPANPQNGGLTIKDLERSMGTGGTPNPGDRGDPNTVPMPNVTHDHVMDTGDLVDLLKDAGVANETLAKLGYDDLDKVAQEVTATKDNVVSAINKASEDMMKVGNRYPGGHLVNYAKAQMVDFFKPVITWEMAMKKLTESVGKGQRHAPEEPWTIYHVDAADMGFRNQREVPYMGSMVPGKQMKPLVIDIIDTSGSVDDAMLKRFVSEALNQARKMSRGNAPDVVISFADTIARGAPEFITEQNYKKFLAGGINYGGRGGTNFQASIENVFELVKPGTKTPYAKREIDAIVYMTDTGDSVPDPARLLAKALECGLKKLPPILFLAPQSCFSQSFNDDVKKWASVVWFDCGIGNTKTTKVKLDDIAQEQERKQRGLAPARA